MYTFSIYFNFLLNVFIKNFLFKKKYYLFDFTTLHGLTITMYVMYVI